MKTQKITVTAMLIALSIVLVLLIHFPIFPAASYLEYTPADVPMLIVSFAFGPTISFIATIILAVIQGITVSAGSGPYGIIMHIIATGTYVLISGLIYQRKKTLKTAFVSLIVGSVAMVAVMTCANLLITPHFTGMPLDVIKGMIVPITIPFNVIKVGINSTLTFLLYKPMMGVFKFTDIDVQSAHKKGV